jgi:hypothetical protein
MVSADYSISPEGWGSLRLMVDGQAASIGLFGSNTDALGDLVRGALHLAAGGATVSIRLDGEPEKWALRLSRKPGSLPPAPRLRIQARYAEEGFDADKEGVPVLDLECDLNDFALAIATTAAHVAAVFGDEGYARVWGGMEGFPRRALTALQAALAVVDPPGRMP